MVPVFSRAPSKPCSKCMDRWISGRLGRCPAQWRRETGWGVWEALVVMVKSCRHAKAAAPTGLAVVTMETNRAGASEWGKQPELSGAITRTIRGWAAPRSAQHVTTATQKRRKMPGMAV